MDFNQANELYRELQSRHDSGQLSPQDFEAQVNELTITDARGRQWMIGVKTGKWYVLEGAHWVQASPPGSAPEPAPPPIAPPESGKRTLRLIVGIAVAALIVLAIAAGGILLFISTQGGRLSNQPTALAPSTPTRASASNTLAPIASPSVNAGTPTGASVPTSVAIPTATLLVSTLPSPTETAGRARPGVYVTALRTDPPQLKRAQPITFIATLLNTTGGPVNDRLLALLFRLDETRNFGETTRKTVMVPNGVSIFSLVYTGVTGINNCENYRAKLVYDDEGLFDIYKTDGSVLWLNFAVCP